MLALAFLLLIVAMFVSFFIVIGAEAASSFVLNTGARPTTLPNGFWLAMLRLHGDRVADHGGDVYLAPPLIMIHNLSPPSKR